MSRPSLRAPYRYSCREEKCSTCNGNLRQGASDVRYPPEIGAKADPARLPLCADYVEKLICASERERLIQDQAPTRNNDSRTDPPGFLYCKFCFHSARSASFSTQSANRRHARVGGAVVRVPALLRPLPIVLRAAAQRPPFGFNSAVVVLHAAASPRGERSCVR